MPANDDQVKLGKLIRGVAVAMMTTVDERGEIHSRPMAVIDLPFEGYLWFITDVRSHKVHELEQEHHVNVDFVDQARERFVSCSGVAHIVHEPDKVRELWQPQLKSWFPVGKDDPNLSTLRVEVKRAHYWDRPTGRIVQLIGMVKAIASGERYEPGGEHELRFH